jgi:hypothetical protein
MLASCNWQCLMVSAEQSSVPIWIDDTVDDAIPASMRRPEAEIQCRDLSKRVPPMTTTTRYVRCRAETHLKCQTISTWSRPCMVVFVPESSPISRSGSDGQARAITEDKSTILPQTTSLSSPSSPTSHQHEQRVNNEPNRTPLSAIHAACIKMALRSAKSFRGAPHTLSEPLDRQPQR